MNEDEFNKWVNETDMKGSFSGEFGVVSGETAALLKSIGFKEGEMSRNALFRTRLSAMDDINRGDKRFPSLDIVGEALDATSKSKKAFTFKDLFRREFIKKALKEGKPVPADVLRDYPDLAAKYAKGAAKSKIGANLKKAETSAKIDADMVKQPVDMSVDEFIAWRNKSGGYQSAKVMESLYPDAIPEKGFNKKTDALEGAEEIATQKFKGAGGSTYYLSRNMTLEAERDLKGAKLKTWKEWKKASDDVLEDREESQNRFEREWHRRLIEKYGGKSEPVKARRCRRK